MAPDRTRFVRSSGILLPVSCLPSPYGIGSLGKAARKWIDFLDEADQSFWQILPLGPTCYGNSPYQSPSAFAGNPSYIDLDTLYEEGLLKKAEFKDLNWSRTKKLIDYDTIGRKREGVLHKAFERFKGDDAIEAFKAQSPWAEEYALFMAIRESIGMLAWTDWDEPLRKRQKAALLSAGNELKEEVRFHIFMQYMFTRQWQALHAYANAKGVEIIGDIPIYIALDSADVWAEPGLFQLDKNSIPTGVAGCPPDSFSAKGQVWGNPLYDWKVMAKTGYDWWIRRLKHSFELFDALRIDHFRGLEDYYAIPYGAITAKDGKWKPGPGKDFISAVKAALPDRRVIAEDLGYLTESVKELVAFSGYPSMKVLQFAFDTRVTGEYRPFTYGKNSVVYPGTHDNDTLKGWCKAATEASVKKAMDYIGVDRVSELPAAMLRVTMQCNSDLAVILMQDWLGLGSEARINTPSTVCGRNWRWRLGENDLNNRLAASISHMTSLYGRSRSADGGET